MFSSTLQACFLLSRLAGIATREALDSPEVDDRIRQTVAFVRGRVMQAWKANEAAARAAAAAAPDIPRLRAFVGVVRSLAAYQFHFSAWIVRPRENR